MQRFVAVADAVVRFVAVTQPLEDLEGLRGRRRFHIHRLEAALQRTVLLDVLAVLVERGRTDALDFTARQRRLEHVRGIDRALGTTCTHQGVQLVDEQHHIAHAAHFGHDRFDALFELTAVLGASHHQGEVEHHDALVAQDLGHAILDDLLSQTFDDGRLAHTGLAQQHRVVLRAAREDLDHALDFIRAPDHRIQLAFARQFGQVATKAVERRRLALAALRFLGGRRRGTFLLAAFLVFFLIRVGAQEVEHFFAHILELDAQVHEHLGRNALVLFDQAEQQVFGTNVVVAEIAGLFHRQLQHLLGAGCKGKLTHRHHRRTGLDDLLDLAADLGQVDPHVLEHIGGDARALLHQAQQNVLGT